jgi:hypothetical protein
MRALIFCGSIVKVVFLSLCLTRTLHLSLGQKTWETEFGSDMKRMAWETATLIQEQRKMTATFHTYSNTWLKIGKKER